MGYSIGEVAKITGLSTYTLRFYEKEGLLPFVRKSRSGVRVFLEEDIGWLRIIECLKETGMPLKGIKQYIDWYRAGDETLQKRLDMFKQQEIKVQEQLKHLQNNMEKISYKIKLYTSAVQCGSLERAQQNPAFIQEKKRLFGHR